MIVSENWKKISYKELCRIILDIYPDAQLPHADIMYYLRSIPKVRIDIQNNPTECKTTYHLIGMGLLYHTRLGEIPQIADAPFTESIQDIETNYAFQIHPNNTGKIIRYKEPQFTATFLVNEPDNWEVVWQNYKPKEQEVTQIMEQGRRQLKKLLKL